jgi:hypothetical protein
MWAFNSTKTCWYRPYGSYETPTSDTPHHPNPTGSQFTVHTERGRGTTPPELGGASIVRLICLICCESSLLVSALRLV